MTEIEKPQGYFRPGYGDRVIPLARVGSVWTETRIKDDGSAVITVYDHDPR